MKKKDKMKEKGFVFKKYEEPNITPFEKLFEIFKELITHTSGDLDEALDWLRQLEEEYQLTTSEYTIDDFIEDLKQKGYIKEELDPDGGEDGDGSGNLKITAKTERAIRQQALDQIFGKMRKGNSGNHRTSHVGRGDEHTGDFRDYSAFLILAGT